MAASYIKIFCNGDLVRVFGGNKSEVRMMKERYERMTVDEFLAKHPGFAEKCKHKKDIVVVFIKK